MAEDEETNKGLLDLQTRIHELERENNRLSKELEARKQDEAIGKQNESLYRMLAANLPNGGAFLVDHNLRYLLAEGRALPAVGFNSESFEGKTIWEVLDRETAAVYEPSYRQTLSGEAFVHEHHNHGRDYISHGTPVFDEKGQIVAALVVSYDITERKQTEEALRQSEERFRFALQGSPIVVFSHDKDLRYTWVYNPSPGFNVEDVLGKRDEDIYQPEDAKLFTSIKRQVLASGIVRRDEVITHRPDSAGGNLVHDMTTEPLCDANGVIIGVICSAVDITERKQAEDALKESQSLLAEAQRIAGIGSWRWDIPTGELRWSDEMYDIYEVDHSIFTPSISSFNDYIHPDDRPMVLQKIEQIMATGAPVDFEFRIVSGTGKERILRTISQVIKFDPSGNPLIMVGANHDITERKRVEQTLRESEERLSYSLYAARAGSWDWDIRSGNIFWTAENYELYDFDRALGSPTYADWESRLHPEDLLRTNQMIADVVSGKLPEYRTEFRVVHRNGRVLWLLGLGSIQRAADGTPLRMSGINIDITERKQMENALRESEERMRLVLNTTKTGIWIDDLVSRQVYWSPETCSIFGVDEFGGTETTFQKFVHPDDLEDVWSMFTAAIEHGGIYESEFRIVRPDGEIRWVGNYGYVEYDADHKPSRFLGTVLDITRRKQIEQALKASEEHFRVAIKNSPVAVYTVDRDLRYTWVYNPPLGLEPEQILGKTDEELNDPVNTAQLMAFKRSVLETGIGKRQEIEWHYQGGTYFYDVTAEPVRGEKGQITGLTVAVIDITQRKQLEAAAQEDQVRIKLQQRLIEQREQERLAVAQEIHDGPAQTIAGAMIELQMARNMVNDPALKAELERIELHMKSTVQELREIISGLRPVFLQRFGFSEAIRQHASDFNEKHPSIDITYAIAEDEGMLSQDTSVSLFRIYQEALKNIAQHAGASRANVRFSLEGEVGVLEIEDNGRGMDTMLDHLLLTENGHYGFAGMKERAEAVGGEFQLLTGSNQGTTITVKVPVNRMQP